MSAAGRLGNLIYDVLHGYELGYGEWQPGWFERAGIDMKPGDPLARELREELLDAIYPMVSPRAARTQENSNG